MLSTHCKIVALMDCNNFYASCERIFNPRLIDKPVLVLSSNDGCVIARSNEVKQLGITVGQPYFQIESLCRRNRVHVFSSNFALYGDISARVMKTLHNLCPDMEIYSIDEAFIRLDRMAVDPVSYATKIKETIFQHVGIPVSIGIAPTKTLAKVATNIAKKNSAIGVYDLRAESTRKIILQNFSVHDIWGIGRKSAERLNQLHIKTAAQLCEEPMDFLKKHFSVMMTRIVMELKGVSCVSLEEMHNKKNITCSRSFGKAVTELRDLLEAISNYGARACEKARQQKSKAHSIYVYLRTSRFSKTKPYYAAADQQSLLFPSNDTVLITEIAIKLIKKLFKPDYHYQKVGIVLLNLTSDHIQQNDLFETDKNSDNKAMMHLLDQVNKKWGSQTLFLAVEGVERSWSVKSIFRSPRYTTSWGELPVASVP